MPGAPPNRGLSPPELVEAATTRSQTSFLALYGASLLLLVRIGEGDAELAIGLSMSRDGPGSTAEPMQFHTVVQGRDETPIPRTRTRTRPEDPAALVQLMGEAHHFAVPLCKREEADAMSADRITVGRARNKDLVMRHASVSKFHAWFETDAAGSLQLTDAGSRNLTRVNGEPLPPREHKRIEPGDRVRFGAVDCVVCSAEVLWAAVRAFGAGVR
jgi:FHA domain